MADTRDEKNKAFVSLDLGEIVGRIERLGSEEGDLHRIRLSSWKNGSYLVQPFDLTEKELAILLQRAIRAGILSADFLNGLHAVIEI